MRESLYRDIQADYEAQRAKNHEEGQRRLEEASKADPRIFALYEDKLRLFRDEVTKAFTNPKNAHGISASLRGRVEALQNEIRQRLALAGFAQDYLQPIYRCPLCQDTGFVGEPIRERCACYKERLLKRALGDTDNGLNKAETFDAYNETIYPDTQLRNQPGDTQRGYMARVFAHCKAYAEQFPGTQKHNILLFGMSGLGKTFMMNCIGNHVVSAGHEAIKLTAYQLSERMRASVFEQDYASFSLLLKTPLLLLDDLGVEPLMNNITIEHLFTILNERILARHHTVISTNLMLDELRARYTERVCSRLFDRRNTSIIKFEGADVRFFAP